MAKNRAAGVVAQAVGVAAQAVGQVRFLAGDQQHWIAYIADLRGRSNHFFRTCPMAESHTARPEAFLSGRRPPGLYAQSHYHRQYSHALNARQRQAGEEGLCPEPTGHGLAAAAYCR